MSSKLCFRNDHPLCHLAGATPWQATRNWAIRRRGSWRCHSQVRAIGCTRVKLVSLLSKSLGDSFFCSYFFAACIFRWSLWMLSLRGTYFLQFAARWDSDKARKFSKLVCLKGNALSSFSYCSFRSIDLKYHSFKVDFRLTFKLLNKFFYFLNWKLYSIYFSIFSNSYLLSLFITLSSFD